MVKWQLRVSEAARDCAAAGCWRVLVMSGVWWVVVKKGGGQSSDIAKLSVG